MLRRSLLLAAFTLLAACQQGEQQPSSPAATNAAAVADDAPGNEVLAQVAALAPRQRDGVLFRAIRDAGHDCQKVSEVKPQPADEGTLAWLATCDGREQWLVAMDRTGTALVVDARTAARSAR